MTREPVYWLTTTNSNYVLLEDKANVAGSMSITNAAEEVVEDLIANGHVKHDTIIYYIDTEQRVDLLLHDGVKFTGFQSGFDTFDEFQKQVMHRVDYDMLDKIKSEKECVPLNKVHVIFMNDGPMYAYIGPEELAHLKSEELAEAHYDKIKYQCSGIGQFEDYDDYRRRCYWHIHTVECNK